MKDLDIEVEFPQNYTKLRKYNRAPHEPMPKSTPKTKFG